MNFVSLLCPDTHLSSHAGGGGNLNPGQAASLLLGHIERQTITAKIMGFNLCRSVIHILI